jgi:hypothetical protein
MIFEMIHKAIFAVIFLSIYLNIKKMSAGLIDNSISPGGQFGQVFKYLLSDFECDYLPPPEVDYLDSINDFSFFIFWIKFFNRFLWLI